MVVSLKMVGYYGITVVERSTGRVQDSTSAYTRSPPLICFTVLLLAIITQLPYRIPGEAQTLSTVFPRTWQHLNLAVRVHSPTRR